MFGGVEINIQAYYIICFNVLISRYILGRKMFNVNDFKKRIKKWIEENPLAQESELIDYCEKLMHVV